MIKSNLDPNKSYVQKRNGIYQEIDYSKIQNRLKYLAIGYPDKANSIQLKKLKHINHFDISKKVIESLIFLSSVNATAKPALKASPAPVVSTTFSPKFIALT